MRELRDAIENGRLPEVSASILAARREPML
jgi:hypothetical protein